MHFVEGGLADPQVQALLQEHLDDMLAQTPVESMHALDLEGLSSPSIAFWSAWREDALLGCGALKDLGEGHAELKSMRTVRAHLRQGVAASMLTHLLSEAQQRGFLRISLETGRSQAYAPALALYARFGFVECEPFADYAPDPLSVFLTRSLV